MKQKKLIQEINSEIIRMRKTFKVIDSLGELEENEYFYLKIAFNNSNEIFLFRIYKTFVIYYCTIDMKFNLKVVSVFDKYQFDKK